MKITDEAVPQDAKLAAVAAYTKVHGSCRPVAMTAALEAALPHLSQGAVSHENAPWLSDIAMKIAIEMEAQSALNTTTVEKAEAICDILSALSPAPVGVTDKALLHGICGSLGAAIYEYQAADVFPGARAIMQVQLEALTAALASHELAPEPAKDGPEVVAWRSRGPKGGWIYRDEPYDNGCEPLVRLSDYEALQAENERLQEENEEWSRRYGALYEDAEKGTARIVELEKELAHAPAALKGQSNERD